MKHPAKTKAQRRVLDEIGCGNCSPPMAKKTRDALLSQGLIVKIGGIKKQNRLGAYEIPEYDMPFAVHYQWCQYQSEQFDKEGLEL